MTLKDYLASVLRTVVPYGVGLLLTWLATKTGVTLPDEPTKTVITGLVAAGYYALVRVVEAKWSVAGWLLGYAVQPTYQKPE